MHKLLSVATLALVFLGCSSVPKNDSGELKYENILMSFPIPGDGWINQTSRQGRTTKAVWQKPNELLTLTIDRPAGKGTPEEMRAKMEKFTRENLVTELKEQTIQEGMINNYPMVFWKTEATLKNGKQIVNLLLFIKGKDANYFIHRRWNFATVSKSELDLWINYFKSINVCDTRYPEHRCPSSGNEIH